MYIAIGKDFVNKKWSACFKQENKVLGIPINENNKCFIPYPSKKINKDELIFLREMIDDALKELE